MSKESLKAEGVSDRRSGERRDLALDSYEAQFDQWMGLTHKFVERGHDRRQPTAAPEPLLKHIGTHDTCGAHLTPNPGADRDEKIYSARDAEALIAIALATSKPKKAAPEPEQGALEIWREQLEIFIADYNRYVNGDPKFPFSVLRQSLASFLETCIALRSAALVPSTERDRLAAEIEALKESLRQEGVELNRVYKERDAALRAKERDAKDAARYRWLRKYHDWDCFTDEFINTKLNIYGGTGDELDAKIDAALKESHE